MAIKGTQLVTDKVSVSFTYTHKYSKLHVNMHTHYIYNMYKYILNNKDIPLTVHTR